MDEKLTYKKKDIIEVLRDLNLLVVSLDRISSEYSPFPDKLPDEKIDAALIDFIFKWKVNERLAHARDILDGAFSHEVGEDDMEELEREFQDTQYWSRKILLPAE